MAQEPQQPFIRASARVMDRMLMKRARTIETECLEIYRQKKAEKAGLEQWMPLIDLADALLEAHRIGQMREVVEIKRILLLRGRMETQS